MKNLIIDASVIAAALFAEQYAHVARKLLMADAARHVPDFIAVELASVIWKRQRRGEISAQEAMDLLADIELLPLMKTPAADLVVPALQLAMLTGRRVYDSLYLALAVRTNGVMITADKRLANALAATPLKKHITFLGNY